MEGCNQIYFVIFKTNLSINTLSVLPCSYMMCVVWRAHTLGFRVTQSYWTGTHI